MTQQSGRPGYRHDQRNGELDQAIDRTRELAEEALDQADEWLKPTGLSIKENPMTVLAVIGGLAFAAGAAFWMLKSSRQRSRYDEVLATLSDLPRRAGWR
jgi:type VI protein secretion system component VasF